MNKIKKVMMLAVCIVLCFSLFGCTTYDLDITDGGWAIGYSKLAKNCFVGSYAWDGDLDNVDIIIPDEYKGYPVAKIGGYYGRGVPTPFYIDLPDTYEIESVTAAEPTDTSDWYPNGYEIEYLDFSLTIGINIKSIDNVDNSYAMRKNQDGSYTLYQVRYYVTCHKDNNAFYSNEGRLYHKSNDEVAGEFKYFDEAKNN